MTTPFDEVFAVAAAAIEDAFGVVAHIIPRSASPYAESVSDPERQPVAVVGKLTLSHGMDRIKGRAVSTELVGVTYSNSSPAEFWIAPERAAALGYSPARGDRLTFPSMPNLPGYSVSQVKTTHLGAVALVISAEDGE
jgi:hypothetical protein